MFDVFTTEIEQLIQTGISNLYWFKIDLHKAWLQSGVPLEIKEKIRTLRREDGELLTKQQQMMALYERLRDIDYNRRLEISRNFVRILVQQKSFTPLDPRHKIELAERSALKLREILLQQQKNQEAKEMRYATVQSNETESYGNKLKDIQKQFSEAIKFPPQQRGYALEKIFNKLMEISNINVQKPFQVGSEQFDGAIKYDGHYYLVELKWTEQKTSPKEIGHFFYKVSGKLDTRGIFISMSGFTDGAVSDLPKGKDLGVLLFNGVHLTNVISGLYKFSDLLDYAVQSACLYGKIYCSTSLTSI